MKIAFPIALIVFGVVFIAILMTPNHQNQPTPDEWKSDHDRIAKAKQQLLDSDPVLKAEDADLNSRYEQTEKAVRDARQSDSQAHAALINHDRKVRDALTKADPTLTPPYEHQELDRRIPTIDDQVLYGEYHGSLGIWAILLIPFIFYVIPALCLALGIYLLFRPPTLAATHLFLIFLIMPLVLLGPLMLRFAIAIYLMRFDEPDYAPTPYMFHTAHHMLAVGYLCYVPSVLIYIILLFRIRAKERMS